MSDEELARHLQEEENRAAAARRMQPMYAQYPTTMVNRLRITILQVCSHYRSLHPDYFRSFLLQRWKLKPSLAVQCSE